MSKELVIGSNRHETKVAILEEDQLVEVYFQRANEYSLAGSIHKGRVTRVLPGMQSAFVDLGLGVFCRAVGCGIFTITYGGPYQKFCPALRTALVLEREVI